MPSVSLRELIRRDAIANRGYPKSTLVLVLFRVAHHLKTRRQPWAKLIYFPIGILYKFTSEWILGIEIPVATKIGAGLRLRHGIGVVINPYVVIGQDVMIRQNVTLGNRYTDDDTPSIADHVEIGAGAIIIGRCSVGEGARIAAGAVVINDVPAYGIAHPVAATIRTGRSRATKTETSS